MKFEPSIFYMHYFGPISLVVQVDLCELVLGVIDVTYDFLRRPSLTDPTHILHFLDCQSNSGSFVDNIEALDLHMPILS